MGGRSNRRGIFTSLPVSDGGVNEREADGIESMEKKKVFEETTSFLFSSFRSGFCWSFFSSSCNFFIIWHFPLQRNWGRTLFSQFLANDAVFV